MTWRRWVSLVLVIAAGVSFGGAGHFVHEHAECAEAAHHEGFDDLSSPVGHDAEHCAVCHLLSAARIDRVVGESVVVTVVDSPEKSWPRDETTPRCFHVHTPIDARGPPRAHFA